jgi:hypothetical protein
MAWTQVADLTGSQGPQGPTGPQGPQGVAGPTGPAGESVSIAGQVATYANLPTGLTAADAGDGYLVDADGLLYVWGGSSFPAGLHRPAGADWGGRADWLHRRDGRDRAGWVARHADLLGCRRPDVDLRLRPG